jgi:hypothetical protein
MRPQVLILYCTILVAGCAGYAARRQLTLVILMLESAAEAAAL